MLPVDGRPGSNAEKGLLYCNRLFEYERAFAALSAEERYIKRNELSLPVATEFLDWAKTYAAHPKSAVVIAMAYYVNQWPYLSNVFTDGRLELSNNRAERSIKPFVIGRKNWLFSNSQKGAKASSVIYSIIQTAIENGLVPFKYLKMLFEILPNTSTGQITSLLPWVDAVKDLCGVDAV